MTSARTPASGVRHLLHLARRFFASLSRAEPTAEEQAWVAGVLTAREQALFATMPGFDRRHAIEVAAGVEAALGGREGGVERAWLVAALLHDVGKVDSGLGVGGRVLATVAVAVVGPDTASRWAGRAGFAGRIGRYCQHPARGAAMLAAAGAPEAAVAWTRVHQDGGVGDGAAGTIPGIPPDVARALSAADDD